MEQDEVKKFVPLKTVINPELQTHVQEYASLLKVSGFEEIDPPPIAIKHKDITHMLQCSIAMLYTVSTKPGSKEASLSLRLAQETVYYCSLMLSMYPTYKEQLKWINQLNDIYKVLIPHKTIPAALHKKTVTTLLTVAALFLVKSDGSDDLTMGNIGEIVYVDFNGYVFAENATVLNIPEDSDIRSVIDDVFANLDQEIDTLDAQMVNTPVKALYALFDTYANPILSKIEVAIHELPDSDRYANALNVVRADIVDIINNCKVLSEIERAQTSNASIPLITSMQDLTMYCASKHTTLQEFEGKLVFKSRSESIWMEVAASCPKWDVNTMAVFIDEQ